MKAKKSRFNLRLRLLTAAMLLLLCLSACGGDDTAGNPANDKTIGTSTAADDTAVSEFELPEIEI